MAAIDLEMPWVLSGCRNSSNLTSEQATTANVQKGKIAKEIFLGIDTHENSFEVARKIDAGGIQPVQRFKPDKFLGFVARPWPRLKFSFSRIPEGINWAGIEVPTL
jgi:hypothetical protein